MTDPTIVPGSAAGFHAAAVHASEEQATQADASAVLAWYREALASATDQDEAHFDECIERSRTKHCPPMNLRIGAVHQARFLVMGDLVDARENVGRLRRELAQERTIHATYRRAAQQAAEAARKELAALRNALAACVGGTE